MQWVPGKYVCEARWTDKDARRSNDGLDAQWAFLSILDLLHRGDESGGCSDLVTRRKRGDQDVGRQRPCAHQR